MLEPLLSNPPQTCHGHGGIIHLSPQGHILEIAYFLSIAGMRVLALLVLHGVISRQATVLKLRRIAPLCKRWQSATIAMRHIAKP